MNRHQSNPFLSDWDKEDELPRPVGGSSIFDDHDEPTTGQDATSTTARRSSCSQMQGGHSVTGQSNRQGLYRRNMSSFEAASSLQYEQEQQQLKQNGSNAADLLQQQKELIAKMTADFQSAIETSDKQFVDDLATFNPFDPFETIVDDDSLPLASPAASATGPALVERPAEIGDLHEGSTATTGRLHDSIDDDEEELVSTPVRNIKSSPNSGEELVNDTNHKQQQQTQQQKQRDGRTIDNEEAGQDSIAKASLFASLLASAENASGQDLADGVPTANGQSNYTDEMHGSADEHLATSHVIKGSPTAADGSSERPVSFFDPFETVIDKDALSSLVSERAATAAAAAATVAATAGQEGRANELSTTPARVEESTSIETVIENQPSSGNENSPPATNKHADGNDDRQQVGPAINTANDKYEASTALARPSQRVVSAQLASGITPPQPTPAKRPLKQTARSRVQRRGDAESDSSSSSDEDDRIKVVIRARDVAASKTGESADGAKSAFVPLLPPPPSKSSMKQARERGQVEDIPSPIMSYKSRQRQDDSESEDEKLEAVGDNKAQVEPAAKGTGGELEAKAAPMDEEEEEEEEAEDEGGQFVIPMTLSDNEDDNEYGKPETPLYDEDTSYVLDEFPAKFEGAGWEMMLRYPPKKKLTANRFWKKIFVKLAQVPLAPDSGASSKRVQQHTTNEAQEAPALCWALQIFDHQEDKKPMQEIPIQATYTVSEISSQLFDQFGKIFTIKLQYIFYKERVGVRQGQLARFIHTGHIGSSTTSGGHGVDPISIGAIKRMGAPIEHSPQISQIIKLGCTNYENIKIFKETLEDCLFRMPIHRDRALTTYKTEEVQMAVRDETYIEINQIGTVTKQLARVRLFFLSFLNGMPLVEVGVNEYHRQGREVVGRMDILPVITEEWIRLEAWELHSTVDKDEFDNEQSRLIKLTPPDATFFELMRFRVRPPRNRELPLQISANMTVTRTRVSFNCDVMVPGCVSRKHGQIPCENIAIRLHIPECWIYFFREEKHFRMGSKKSVNRRPGKVKGIERFLGGGGSGAGVGAALGSSLSEFGDESSLIEVTSGQAKYEHHHHGVVWRAARWPKESQSAYVQNSMKIRLPLTAYDKMPESFYEYLHVEYSMPATTVSHTTLRSISVNPCEDEPPEKYVKYAAKYEYKVKMRLSVNLGNRRSSQVEANTPEVSPIVMMKQRPDDELEREKDEDDDDDDDEDQDEADGAINDANVDADNNQERDNQEASQVSVDTNKDSKR